MNSPRWSYSKIKAFNTCPRQYYNVSVLNRYPKEDTAATLYGTEFHLAAENFIESGTPLEPRFKFAEPALTTLRNMKGDKLCEYEMGLTEEHEPCGMKNPNAWWRGIADLIILNGTEARVVDYKTGASAKYADPGQLELMAMAVFKHFPQVLTIKAGLMFVVANAFIREVYAADRQSELWAKWLGEYKKFEKAHSTGVWNPKSSGLCRKHCPVLECEHNGKND